MYYRRTSMPKSSGGALANVIILIFSGLFIIGLGVFMYCLFSGDKYKGKGWVEVTAKQTDVDCNGLYCPGFDSDPDGCRKCTVHYEFEYAGEKYDDVSFDARPSPSGKLKVFVDPQKPYISEISKEDNASMWVIVLIVECLLGGFLFFAAWRFWQWYRLYKTAEKEGRLEELLRQLEDQGILDREDG